MIVDLKIKDETFVIVIRETYALLEKKKSFILIQFSISYLCELEFYFLTNIKCKNSERLLST